MVQSYILTRCTSRLGLMTLSRMVSMRYSQNLRHLETTYVQDCTPYRSSAARLGIRLRRKSSDHDRVRKRRQFPLPDPRCQLHRQTLRYQSRVLRSRSRSRRRKLSQMLTHQSRELQSRRRIPRLSHCTLTTIANVWYL
jgi:hypothetical protein